jgi:hypothetical protein
VYKCCTFLDIVKSVIRGASNVMVRLSTRCNENVPVLVHISLSVLYKCARPFDRNSCYLLVLLVMFPMDNHVGIFKNAVIHSSWGKVKLSLF